MWYETSEIIIKATEEDTSNPLNLQAAEGQAFSALQALAEYYTSEATNLLSNVGAGAATHATMQCTPCTLNAADEALLLLEAHFLSLQVKRLLESGGRDEKTRRREGAKVKPPRRMGRYAGSSETLLEDRTIELLAQTLQVLFSLYILLSIFMFF